jgi:transcriptional regulator NrdR family protein
MNPQLMVIKRNGIKEKFDRKKIQNVVKTAGLSDEKTSVLISNIEKWINTLDTKSVSSINIRDKISEELKNLDNKVANLFNWYQNTKE